MKYIETKRRTSEVFRSKYAFPIPGVMIAQYKVIDSQGTSTIQKGLSGAINMQNNINFMLENIRIQCAFGHLTDTQKIDRYSDSDDVVDDIGDDLFFELQNYLFEYPKMKGDRKYKFISVRGKRYFQEFRKVQGKFRFSRRLKVSGVKEEQKRNIELSRELM